MSNQARLLLGTEHPCSYLELRQARSMFVDPKFPLDAGKYAGLLQLGFRRSGAFVYRPACQACAECRPARIPVAQFAPDRGQRRCIRANADLRFMRSSALSDEHYGLYRRYLAARHPCGGMDPEDKAAFHQFLECPWGRTEAWDFRRADGRLMITAIVDLVPQGLSAVYTFFDPAERRRSLGTYAILRQVQEARAAALPYLYLGYWIRGSRTMDYKRRFHPLECLETGGWRRTDPATGDKSL